ncbi:MAG: fused MFS/spermidine synthase [Planctomycetes bacterium]|nr:fused MFS/spermidine synthase [Planctomycetota bacterium]
MTDPNAPTPESNRHFYDRIAGAYDLIADANERTAREAGVRALAPAPGEAVLELGFGTGNEVLDLAGLVGPGGKVAGIDVSPGMLAVANRKLAASPAKAPVDLRVGDARDYLRATDRRFDVIVSDLFVPWESETGSLYTVEHYRTARRRLNADGLFCQWLPVYQLGPEELHLIADSFAAVFPDVSLWWGHLDPGHPIIALIGSNGPLAADSGAVDRRLQRLWSIVPLDREIRTARDVSDLYLGHWRPRQPDRLNTDEHPRVEFLTPISQADRTLLYGEALRRYSDNVLARLPDRPPLSGPVDDAEGRRSRQRHALLGR